MNIIIGDRGKGKTTQIIEWFLDDPHNRVIITHSEHYARQLRSIVFRKSVSSRNREISKELLEKAITYPSGLISTRYKGKQIGIDNVEMVLANFFNNGIDTITANLDGKVTLL